MAKKNIEIRGARTQNLKNIDVDIPKDKLTVITGLSGSGKSSLAFDTLYAEGQRRYVESLSSYARQFLGQMDKPDVDSIDGLSPAISIDQKTTSNNPRSTVGTVTEINDYFRLLFARVGRPDDPEDGTQIVMTIDQMVEKVYQQLATGSRLQVFAPIISHKRGSHETAFDNMRKQGYIRARVDGKIIELDTDTPKLNKNQAHDIDVMVDRVVLRDDGRSRLFDSIEAAVRLTDGLVTLNVAVREGESPVAPLKFSDHYLGALRDFRVGRLEPRLFSFNAPLGACEVCQGLGVTREVDIDLVVPDTKKTLREGAIAPWNPISSNYYPEMLQQFAEQFNIDMDKPFEKLPEKVQQLILYGSATMDFHFHYKNDFGGVRDVDMPFEGVINNISRRFNETNSDFTRDQMANYMTELACQTCHGYRLNQAALSVKINGKHIGEVSELPVDQELAFFKALV